MYELCVYVYVYVWIYFRSSLLCLHTLNPFLFYIVCKSHCYQFWALDILRTKCGKCENLCFLLSLLTVRGSIENCCSALCQLPSHCDMDVYHTKKFSYNLMSFRVYTLYEVYRNVCILCVFFVCTLLCVCVYHRCVLFNFPLCDSLVTGSTVTGITDTFSTLFYSFILSLSL